MVFDSTGTFVPGSTAGGASGTRRGIVASYWIHCPGADGAPAQTSVSSTSLAVAGGSLSNNVAGGAGGAIMQTAVNAPAEFGVPISLTGAAQYLSVQLQVPIGMTRPTQRPRH